MSHSARIALLALCLALAANPAQAFDVSFSGWREQPFRLFDRVAFSGTRSTLTIRANDAASLTYLALPPEARASRRASWSWSVTQSVPPTPLGIRGGDDRNIALYFAFLPEAEAAALGPNPNLRRLLRNRSGRVLVYVFGGDAPRGAMIRSPYLDDRGMLVIRRPSGTGSATESVDLAADYARAFGGAPGALVAVAVSADSDDTDSVIRATVSDLRLE